MKSLAISPIARGHGHGGQVLGEGGYLSHTPFRSPCGCSYPSVPVVADINMRTAENYADVAAEAHQLSTTSTSHGHQEKSEGLTTRRFLQRGVVSSLSQRREGAAYVRHPQPRPMSVLYNGAHYPYRQSCARALA
jgi:hypothetical protein